MTSLFAARRAAEEFADLVDGTRPDVADRYDALSGVVTLLREQPRVEARPEFVGDLRLRLLAAADTELAPSVPALRPVPSPIPSPVPNLALRATPRPIPGSSARPRRLGTAAAAALVVVGGATGVAAAASGALPGEGLYSVKRGIETAAAGMNTTDAGKGTDLLRHAGTRLAEVEALSAAGADAATIRETLADFEESAQRGAGLLFSSYQSTGRSSDIATVRDFTADQQATLGAIADDAPAESSGDLASAATVLDRIESEALEYCAGCGGSGFDDVAASAALQSLITAPSVPAQSPKAPQAHQSSLAAQAEQAAGGVAAQSGTTAPAPTAPAPALTSAPDPAATSPLKPVQDAVQGLTGPLAPATEPVTGVVDQLGDATLLTTVTDPVTVILDGLG